MEPSRSVAAAKTAAPVRGRLPSAERRLVAGSSRRPSMLRQDRAFLGHHTAPREKRCRAESARSKTFAARAVDRNRRTSKGREREKNARDPDEEQVNTTWRKTTPVVRFDRTRGGTIRLPAERRPRVGGSAGFDFGKARRDPDERRQKANIPGAVGWSREPARIERARHGVHSSSPG